MKTFKKGDYVWANVAACYVKGSDIAYSTLFKMPKILIPCKLLQDVIKEEAITIGDEDYLIESTHLHGGKTYIYVYNIKTRMNSEEIFTYLMES